MLVLLVVIVDTLRNGDGHAVPQECAVHSGLDRGLFDKGRTRQSSHVKDHGEKADRRTGIRM